MSDDRLTIEHYAQAFERCLAGPAREKTRSRAELVAHLYDAAEAGELAEAVQRLGSPRSAAALFTRAGTAPLASINQRLRAALIDLLPLIGVTIALTVRQVQDGSSVQVAFPPSYVYQPGGGSFRPWASRSPWPGRSWCWASWKAAPAPRPVSDCSGSRL